MTDAVIEKQNGRIRIYRENVSDITLSQLEKLAEEMNKRARRLGIEEIKINILDQQWKEIKPELDLPYSVKVLKIEILGPAVPLVKPGYKLVGLVQSAIDGQDINSAVEKKDNPDADITPLRIVTKLNNEKQYDMSYFRDTPAIVCEACKTRRKRNTIIVLEDTNQDKLIGVGTECSTVYIPTPVSNVEFLANLEAEVARITGEDDDSSDGGGFGGGGPRNVFELNTILRTVASYLNFYPYLSRSKAVEPQQPTTQIILDLFSHGLAKDEWIIKIKQDIRSVIDSDKITADVAGTITWLESIKPISDFDANLSIAYKASRDFAVTQKTLGFMVYAVFAYKKEQQKLVEEAIKKAKGIGIAKVGTIGKRENFGKATVVGMSSHDSVYGTTHRVKMILDANGAVLIWWATSKPQLPGLETREVDGKQLPIWRDVVVGDVVDVTASVKSHDVYKGEQQTVITRASFTLWDAPKPTPEPKKERKPRQKKVKDEQQSLQTLKDDTVTLPTREQLDDEFYHLGLDPQ